MVYVYFNKWKLLLFLVFLLRDLYIYLRVSMRLVSLKVYSFKRNIMK